MTRPVAGRTVAGSGPAPAGSPRLDRLRSAAVRGTAWLGLANVLAKGIQVVTTLTLAAFLQPADLGLVALVTAVLQIAGMLQSMGLLDVLATTRRDPMLMSGTLATATTVIGTVAAGLGIWQAEALATWLGSPAAAPLLRLVCVALPLTGYFAVQVGIMSRRLEFRRRVVSDGGSSLLGAVVTIVLAARGWGASSAVLGLVVTSISAPVLALFAGVRVPFAWSGPYLREAAGWIWIAGPGALIGLLIVNLDYLVLMRILGDGPTGVYALAFRFAFFPYTTIAMVLGGVAFPILAELHRDDDRALVAVARRFYSAGAIALFGTYAILAVLAERVSMLGPEWADSAPVLRWLCLYGALLSINVFGLNLLRAVGRKHRFLLVQAVHLVVLLTLGIGLTTTWGVVGMAVAQSFAAAFVLCCTIALLAGAGIVPVTAIMRAIAPAAAVSSALAGLALVPGVFRPAPQVWVVIVEGTGLAVLYLAVITAFERAALRQLIETLRSGLMSQR